jgi:hypothetical protein
VAQVFGTYRGWVADSQEHQHKIAAEISWSRTADRSARNRPAREAFLRRFKREVDPDGKLSPEERRRRANRAKRASMLRLAKRAVSARKAARLTASRAEPAQKDSRALLGRLSSRQRSNREAQMLDGR